MAALSKAAASTEHFGSGLETTDHLSQVNFLAEANDREVQANASRTYRSLSSNKVNHQSFVDAECFGPLSDM